MLLPRDIITSSANPRIKQARKLLRRRGRLEQGRVLLEGVRLVRDAWLAQARLELCFYAPELLQANEAGAQLLADLAGDGVELLACSTPVFAGLTDTVTPQGLVAVAALPQLALPLPSTLTLLLDRVRDPGNAGTLLRSAEAAGVDGVLFGPESVDPYNDKVLRAAMGAHFRQPLRLLERWTELEEAPFAAALGNARWYVAEADSACAYEDVDWTLPSVLVVGGEAQGAGDVVRAKAQPICIPMAGGAESLNAAVAGSVILFEIARQRRISKKIARLS
jgi:TrmH family RNA methyltransferase